jgi:hypothetical protein
MDDFSEKNSLTTKDELIKGWSARFEGYRIPRGDERPKINGRECHSTDWNLWFEGDLARDASIIGDHSHVFIDGAMQAGSTVTVRQGLISVSSIGENAKVQSYVPLVIVDDLEASKHSKNMTSNEHGSPIIIEVPADKRGEIFREMIQDPQRKLRVHYEQYSQEELDAFSDAELDRIDAKVIGASIGKEAEPEERMDATLHRTINSLKERGLVNKVYKPGRGVIWQAGQSVGR